MEHQDLHQNKEGGRFFPITHSIGAIVKVFMLKSHVMDCCVPLWATGTHHNIRNLSLLETGRRQSYTGLIGLSRGGKCDHRGVPAVQSAAEGEKI